MNLAVDPSGPVRAGSAIRWLSLGACLLLLFGCGKKNRSGGRPAPPPYMVEVITVQPRAFREVIFATGTLQARESVTLQAERSGALTEVRFDEGKLIKAGEVLAVIDDSELQAQLQRAQAQLELATAIEKRDRSLIESGQLISEAEFEQTRANLNIAKAETELIRAQLVKTRVRAPFDGVAGLRRISIGAYVTPGTPIASVQDIRTLKLDFTLPERYLANLRDVENVTFRVAGASDPIPAEVYAIEPLIDLATRSLVIRALAANKDLRLLPGAFAEVQVALEEIPDAILIPPIALAPGLKVQKVFVHRNGEVEEREVVPGLRTADAVQIVKGLAAGDELIVSGILQLRAGMKVQVRPAASRAATDGGQLTGATNIPGVTTTGLITPSGI
jgi:membrane fusion protein (multidrug efflux system)